MRKTWGRSSNESMSPSSDVPQTPEVKSTSGIASVFKTLTGGRIRSPAPPTVSSTAVPSHNVQVAQRLRDGTSLTREIYGGPADYDRLYQQLRSGKSLADRLAAAEALRHAVQDYPLHGVINIWYAGKDLIEADNPHEVRAVGYNLLTACVQHAGSTDLQRKEYFDTITSSLVDPDDFHLQLAALVELAQHGRNLSGFHYDLIPLLTKWLESVYVATKTARKAFKAQKSNDKKAAITGEETNLEQLFNFMIDVIKFSFNVSDEHRTAALIDELLSICGNTTVHSDLRAAINIINTIITYGDIPINRLGPCIQTISAIHCLVPEFEADAWRTISMLAKSHHGQSTVRILLDSLLNPSSDVLSSGKQSVREIRGSISVLKVLFSKDGKNGYPLVPFSILMEGLKTVAGLGHTKVNLDILNLILSLFGEQSEPMYENVMEESWSTILSVAAKCAKLAEGHGTSRSAEKIYRTASPLSNLSVREDREPAIIACKIVASLVDRITYLLITLPHDKFLQRDDCIGFLLSQHEFITDEASMLVIDHFVSFRLCYPSEPEWQENFQTILCSFFTRSNRPAGVRLHALKAVTDVFEVVEMMDESGDPDCIWSLVSSILEGLSEEQDTAIVQEAIQFAVSVAESAESRVFEHLIDILHESLVPGRSSISATAFSPAASSGVTASSPSQIITKGLVQIFMRSMDRDIAKALRAFDEILWVAKHDLCEADARIAALKMLFRLRADWAHRVFLTAFTESDRAASSLYRTSESLARKQETDEILQQHRVSRAEESAVSRGAKPGSSSVRASAVRVSSGINRALHLSHPIWLSPDLDALPEPISERASSIIYSFLAGADESSRYLRADKYLEIVMTILSENCDWEVYSYVLVHLPSQLTNHTLFRCALPQMHDLISLICEQIRISSFREPPISSGLRKADIAICLFNVLTVVVSYHGREEANFSRYEDDEIVRTFVHGVGAWERAAKSCIHALSVCCHEIPESITRLLSTILQKMSQIITQAQVAVHVLEFLGSLARLPQLFSNFREDDYRMVFGICFRYLQYVRDQSVKSSSRAVSNDFGSDNSLHPRTADELPQYVYSLAYHVVIFWFLSLRLPDRAGQVSWIAKNLVSIDQSGKENIDEQAQVTLDFMQRVAFADRDESKPDPNFTIEKCGEIVKRTWVIGSSIVTIEQATRGGWAQLTKRQASGTSCYVIRENFERPPPHQISGANDNQWDGKQSSSTNILPSHLLLQLYPSTFRASGAEHPVPLPDDDQVKRAIKFFDLVSAVDGHKIGVVYIGEGQTQESEILANVKGSFDYTEFLSNLGTLIRLKGATFNTQGLDRAYDTDGEYAFCWRDRVSEIVFHATTQMPTDLERDPQCINKKRHIGNDFVNIIFNNSGLPFRFDTFPSQFNYVNIVISPESRASFVATRSRGPNYAKIAFYKVQVMSQPGFPEISPAADTKIVSLYALADFVRLLAINASVFTQVWQNRDQRDGNESVSSWRNRLRQINGLRDKYKSAPSVSDGNGVNSASPPGTAHSNGNSVGSNENKGMANMRDSLSSIRRGSMAFLTNVGDPRSSSVSLADTEATMAASGEAGCGEEGRLLQSVDFSRWA